MPWSNFVIKSVHHIQQSSPFQKHHLESGVFRTVTMKKMKSFKKDEGFGLNHIDQEESCLEERRLMMVAANLKMPIWVESFGVKIGWSKSDTLRRTTGVTWCDALRCEIKKIIKGQLSQQPFVRPWLMVREKEKWRTLGCQSRRRERKALDFWGWRAEAEAVTGM